MPTAKLTAVLHRLAPDDTPDGELLTRYVRDRDEAAFAQLVRRHGGMVRAVCKRVLHNDADADDAVQATLLVFVRKAASIRDRNGLANWLFGVAHNVALKARQMRTRRQAKEAGVPRREPKEVASDFAELLHAELAKLPAASRSVIVLCDLEGRTLAEAAGHLNCPPGTVASRLARGREQLAKRLSKYGLSVSGGLVGTLFGEAATAAVAFDLAAVPAHIHTLATEATRAMFTTPKLTKLLAVLAAVAALGGTLVVSGRAGDRPREPRPNAPVPKSLKPDKKMDGVPDGLLGTWELQLRSMTKIEPMYYVTFHADGRVERLTMGSRVVRDESGRYSIDTTADPPRMKYDLSARERQLIPLPKGKPFDGSFKLDGDRLTLRLSETLRPELEREVTTGFYELEYERVSPDIADELHQTATGGQAPPRAPTPPPPAAKAPPEVKKEDQPKKFAPFFTLWQALVEWDGDDKLKLWVQVPVGRFLKLTDAKGRAVHVHDSYYPHLGPQTVPTADVELYDLTGAKKVKGDYKKLLKGDAAVLFTIPKFYDAKIYRDQFGAFLKDDVLILVIPEEVNAKFEPFKNLPEVESLPQVFPGQPPQPGGPKPPEKK